MRRPATWRMRIGVALGLLGCPAIVTSSSGGVAPVVSEDFSTYSSTANMLSNPRGIYDTVEDINTGRIVLDQTTGYGGSRQSMRYDYPAMGAVQTDYTISRMVALPDHPTELWIETAVKFSSNFALDAGVSGVNAAFKLEHVEVLPDTLGRFGYMFVGGQDQTFDSEPPKESFYDSWYIRGTPLGYTLFDNKWHVLRYHVRVTGGQGLHEYWIDGHYMGRATHTTAATAFWGLALARNLNQGPLQAQSMWWGEVKIWTQNPGW